MNAHLLSSQAGYRSAGIHGYIYNTLAHLHDAAPEDWRFTALVGAANSEQFPGVTMRRAAFDTESPLRRIAWEQLIQPWQLGDFDLYHALAFVAPLRVPVPFVVTVYDLSFVHYPAVLTASRRLYLRLFTQLTCQRARRVIAISQSTARDLTETFGTAPDKIDVAVPGYDAQVYRPLSHEAITAFRQQKGLPERFWFFMGTLEPRKNLVTLLEAYASLSPSDRLPLLLGGGKGWLYDDIFATIERHGLQDAVRWLGFLPAEELPFWYNSAEVFVFPSVFEGFGLPVLEAMACGTPVLISDASSLPEIAGEAGLCLPPHEVDAWATALKQVRHDAEWREQARQKGLLDAQRFTWEHTARQTLRSYICSLNIKRQ
ncbi:MAG: glycosyltransferase family 4 protein [Anaerolineae bacterium]|nr:glycosyltransferase family 4 protein [Anaerolineae bacterium]